MLGLFSASASAPAPAPAGTNWAVLIAGSAGYGNYRHHADACHAYHIMLNGGIPASNIILLADDNVANDPANPFPGKLFNKPTAGPGVDVYKGCVIDYRGKDVTPDTFASVLTGDASALAKTGTGRVLKSGPDDKVFVNFVDHGGVDIIGFPATTMHSADLLGALKTMHTKKMYKELVFYMEACESGSMFANLPTDINIFATTAANAKESSWGTYCPGMPGAGSVKADEVNGTEIKSCLGDLYSINWMEDSDAEAGKGETLQQQFELVKKETNKSHVTEFGDLSISSEPIANFQGETSLRTSASRSLASAAERERLSAIRQASSVKSTDAAMVSSFRRYLDGDAAAEEELLREMSERKEARVAFDSIHAAATATLAASNELRAAATPAKLHECHYEAYAAYKVHCGEWSVSAMPHSARLASLCTAAHGDAAPLVAAIRATCAPPAAAAALGGPNPSFDKSPYHVMFAGTTATYFHRTDVHLLTGDLDATSGGTIKAHCLNSTVADYTMAVGAGYKPVPSSSETYYNFTASLDTAEAGATAVKGRLMSFSGQVNEIFFYDPKSSSPSHTSPYAVLSMGPNPRPPPPPPPRCTDAYDAAACKATPKQSGTGCTWCSSKDGVHGLCFAEKATPDDSWKCGA